MKKLYREFMDEIKQKLNQVDETTPNSRVLIVDSLNTFIRCFSAINITNDDGVHIGGISGYLRSVGYAISLVEPTRVIAVFDGEGGSLRRRKIYPDYKGGRKPQVRLNKTDIFNGKEQESQAMSWEIIRLAQYLNNMPITMIAIDKVEADDVIGYIATKVLPESKVTIMSSDKDFLQLVSDRVEVWSPTKKKLYTPASVTEEFGVSPENLTLTRSICGKGDKSDNIKGIRGIGEKTLLKKIPILQEPRRISLNEVVEYATENANDNVCQKVIENKDIVKRNYELMQLSDAFISATAKSVVLDRLGKPISSLNKYKLTKMFMEDKMWAGIPNFNVWMQEHFLTLEHYALLSQKKGVV